MLDNENMKPFLFYCKLGAQQGEERGGGRYFDYRVIYSEDIASGFEKYKNIYREKYPDFSPTKSEKRDDLWYNYFQIVCLKLPYDVLEWNDFNELKISTSL